MMEESHYEELKWGGEPLYSSTNPTSVPSSDTNENTTPNVENTTHSDLNIHGESTALLIVDVQPEYWSNCPAVRQDFEDTFPSSMAELLRIARERKTKIIWVRADYRYSHSPWLQQFQRIHKGRLGTEVKCDVTSVEWEQFATPQGGEVIITKTSWSSTQNTSLIHHLQESGIDTVLVCGLITSVCVQHSAFGIFEAGFRTLLITDCCADRGLARHNAALALYGDYMYELLTVAQLDETLQPARPVWLHRNTGEEQQQRHKTTSPVFTSGSSSPTSSQGSLNSFALAYPVSGSPTTVAHVIPQPMK